MVVLDTDVLVGLLRNDAAAKAKIAALESKGESLQTTIFSIFELMKGAYVSKHRERNVAKLHDLLYDLHVLPFNSEAALLAAKNSADFQAKGIILDHIDNFIASICVSSGQKIITKNLKHFDRVSGLKIESW